MVRARNSRFSRSKGRPAPSRARRTTPAGRPLGGPGIGQNARGDDPSPSSSRSAKRGSVRTSATRTGRLISRTRRTIDSFDVPG
ncbi:MAG: hypothetical protein MZV64_12655 [Ignavibacteriales bacterium]|nr:hypothetical protein [Ignavibacteriales bacterium]